MYYLPKEEKCKQGFEERKFNKQWENPLQRQKITQIIVKPLSQNINNAFPCFPSVSVIIIFTFVCLLFLSQPHLMPTHIPVQCSLFPFLLFRSWPHYKATQDQHNLQREEREGKKSPWIMQATEFVGKCTEKLSENVELWKMKQFTS